MLEMIYRHCRDHVLLKGLLLSNLDRFSFLEDGLALNAQGEMFSWGKGERGQLGHDTVESESPSAIPILKAVSLEQMTARM
jgi:Regulator of chromosome condensation (RCC1) repeat